MLCVLVGYIGPTCRKVMKLRRPCHIRVAGSKNITCHIVLGYGSIYIFPMRNVCL